MSSELPLVTAIMPTRGRRGWAADAVRMFKEQTYAHKELVIVDDQMEPSFASGVPDSGIIYVKALRITVGGKRNLACSRASGQIIVHWDSDDVYRMDRIAHQVTMLLENDVDMVGYNELDFEDVDTGKQYVYVSSSQLYAAGVSLCYWRDTWEQRPFDSVDVGEDNEFQKDRRILCCPADGRITARIHHGNTAEKRSQIPNNSHCWVLKETYGHATRVA